MLGGRRSAFRLGRIAIALLLGLFLFAVIVILPDKEGKNRSVGALLQRQPPKWSRLDSTCSEYVDTLKQTPSRHCCIVCFALNPVETVNYYSFLNHFADASQPYLDSALNFLTDLSSEMGIRQKSVKKIIWVMGDDGTLEESLVKRFRMYGAYVFAHSVRRGSQHLFTLVPNFHFIEKGGFKDEISSVQKSLSDRKTNRDKCVFWRGSTTGVPASSALSQNSTSDCDRLPRIQLARAAVNHSWLDIKISLLAQHCATSRLIDEAYITAQREPENNWVRCIGLIEIDGNVDAWGARWRLQSNSVIFMVESGFVTYYSEKLRAGFHYVEISSDLSDLVEKTKLVTSVDEEDLHYMRSLMHNSAQFARKLTYAKAVRDVVRVLNAQISTF